MQQRYYDPEVGRFISVDPVGVDTSTGTNFNRYWYANNNPYSNIDPDGRVCDSLSGGGCGQNTLGQSTVQPSTGAAVAWGVIGAAGVAAIAGPTIVAAVLANPAGAITMGTELLAGDALGGASLAAGGTALFRVVDDVELGSIKQLGEFLPSPK
jgi:uncharacterized protein RhaS with RHS repeats